MQTYPAELKAQVIAEWKAGSGLRELARAHSIPTSTVKGWLEGQERTVVVQKETEVYDLDKMALELVRGSVSAVAAIHGLTADGTWLRQQNAQQLAILLGVISDKLYRVLGAIRPAVPNGD